MCFSIALLLKSNVRCSINLRAKSNVKCSMYVPLQGSIAQCSQKVPPEWEHQAPPVSRFLPHDGVVFFFVFFLSFFFSSFFFLLFVVVRLLFSSLFFRLFLFCFIFSFSSCSVLRICRLFSPNAAVLIPSPQNVPQNAFSGRGNTDDWVSFSSKVTPILLYCTSNVSINTPSRDQRSEMLLARAPRGDD